jgi:effector-binding domain-containing protein
MYKIGEFSKIGFVTVQALRHYDEIGLLKPVKVEKQTGYRYYSADQLPRIQYISALKNTGLSLGDISLLINDNLSFKDIKKLFILKRSELQKRIKDEQQRLTRVERLLQHIENNGNLPKYQVSIKKVTPQIVASVRDVLPEFSGTETAKMFQELIAFVTSSKAKPAGPTMMIYNDEDYKEQNADIEVAFQINRLVPANGRVKTYELSGIDQAAALVFKGPYEEMGEAYNAVMSWVANNDYHIDGLCRELYLVSPGDTSDPANYISEIQIPVIKAQ